MVRAGETFEHKKCIVEIKELTPYLDAYHKPAVRIFAKITYNGVDPPFTYEPIRFWMPKSDDPRPHVERVIDDFLNNITEMLKGREKLPI